MYSVEHLALSAFGYLSLSMCFERCRVFVEQKLFWLQDVHKQFFLLLGEGTKKCRGKIPELGGTLSQGPAGKLIYPSEEEMKAVEHSELPLGMCFFFFCVH